MNTFDITRRNGDVHTVMVDDEDYDEVMKYNWQVQTYYSGTYAYVTRAEYYYENGKRKQKTIRLHRQILGLLDGNIKADHRDHNGLNNQRSNLREATQQENQFNRNKPRHYRGAATSSKYKGVSWEKSTNSWRARIQISGIVKQLGRFKDEYEAHLAYESAARKYQGEYKNKI